MLSLPSARSTIQAYRSRAVLAIQAVYFVSSAVVLAIFPWSYTTVVVACLVSCTLSLVSGVLAWRGWVRPAVWVLGLQFLGMALGLALEGRGIYDITILVLPAGLMAVAIVERPGSLALFGLANLAAGAVIAWATLEGRIGIPPSQVGSHDMFLDGASMVVILFFVGSLATYISHVLTSLLTILARQNEALEVQIGAQSADLNRTKEELVRHERLAGLGRIVTGVAHELNTPVGNALLAATALQAEGDRSGPDAEALDLVVRSLHRAGDLVARFKRIVVDPDLDHRQPFDLGATVTEAAGLVQSRFLTPTWTLVVEVDPGLACESYPAAVQEIVVNLVENGVVHGLAGQDGGGVTVSGTLVDPGTVRVVVADNGRGIAPDHLTHVFDPFFTTGTGTDSAGLGLTLAWNLATAVLGGVLRLESTLGQGTRAELLFPRVAP